MRSIRPVTFEVDTARFRTVATTTAMGEALLVHGDTATKEYKRAARAILALADGKADDERTRKAFVAALEAAGVFVRQDW